MNIKKNKLINLKKGFTIVESMVAISILTIAIMGATSAAQSGLASYSLSKEQTIAFYLAQEGFEQIRNIRDENRIKKVSWLAGIANNSTDPCFFGELCTVSPIESSTPIRCPSSGCPVIRYNKISGFYGYNSLWDQTNFRREISLKRVNNDEVSITVRVIWTRGLNERKFIARENLLNW